MRTSWFAVGMLLVGVACCFASSIRARMLDVAMRDAAELNETVFDGTALNVWLADDETVDELTLMPAPRASEFADLSNLPSDGLPPELALLGFLPSDEILRRENSVFRTTGLRHSKFRTLRAAKNDLPTGQRRYWLTDLGAAIPLFPRPSLQILFCCWLN